MQSKTKKKKNDKQKLKKKKDVKNYSGKALPKIFSH